MEKNSAAVLYRITPKVLAACITVLVLVSNTSLTSNSFPFYTGTLVYQKETPYVHLDVVDTLDNRERQLLLDGGLHSTMNKTNPDALTDYTSFFPTGLLFNANTENVLFAGVLCYLNIYRAVLMIDLVTPIPLPWFVCRRPVFLFNKYLGMSNTVRFYGMIRPFLNFFAPISSSRMSYEVFRVISITWIRYGSLYKTTKRMQGYLPPPFVTIFSCTPTDTIQCHLKRFKQVVMESQMFRPVDILVNSKN